MFRVNPWRGIAVAAVLALLGCAPRSRPRTPPKESPYADLEAMTACELEALRDRLRERLSHADLVGGDAAARERRKERLEKAPLIAEVVALRYLQKSVAGRRRPVGPRVLELPQDPLTLTIVQRTAKLVPGFAGTVSVRVGDITAGQVLVEVTQPHLLLPLVDTVAVKPGDVVTFALGERKYHLTLTRLQNFIIGDDFAVFELSTTRPTDKRLEALRKAALPQAGEGGQPDKASGRQ